MVLGNDESIQLNRKNKTLGTYQSHLKFPIKHCQCPLTV